MKLAKTAHGVQAMKDRSVSMTPRQRSAFILFDGRRTRDEVLAATAGMGVTADDVDAMVAAGLLADPARLPAGAADLPAADLPSSGAAAAVAAVSVRSPQQRYADAYSIARQLTSGLGLRGFRLNLSLEAASGFDELVQLAPKIREAVGPEKYAPLDRALNG